MATATKFDYAEHIRRILQEYELDVEMLYLTKEQNDIVLPTDLTFVEEPGMIWWEEREHIWKDRQEYRVLHFTKEDVETHKLKAIGAVLKPVLTPEEYARRIDYISEAAARLLRTVEERKARIEEAKNKGGSA